MGEGVEMKGYRFLGKIVGFTLVSFLPCSFVGAAEGVLARTQALSERTRCWLLGRRGS